MFELTESSTKLTGTSMHRISLRHAKLPYAILDTSLQSYQELYEWREEATLTGARMDGADLSHAALKNVKLNDATLEGAVLDHAVFYSCSFSKVNCTNAVIGWSQFIGCDLATTKGLDSVRHTGPTAVDIFTLRQSRGAIPASFLKGCGFSEIEIATIGLLNPHLTTETLSDLLYSAFSVRELNAIEPRSVFISYAHADSDFVDALCMALASRGVRYWRDVEHLAAGRVETQVDRALTWSPVLVVVLSRASVESDWVEWEVGKAHEYAKRSNLDMLCPIALDPSWKNSRWPGPIQNQLVKYNVLDFSGWREPAQLDRQVSRLVSGIRKYYPR